jgi:hypothetical protein
MDRNTRKLFNTKAREAQLVTAPPIPQDLQEGEECFAMMGGKLVWYKKIKGLVFKWVGVNTQPTTITPANGTTQRTYDAASTSIDELADVVATLISDLKTQGVLK